MYRHCIFCRRELGRNQSIEAFSVGRRLAFDIEKGRLWVVCHRCGRWNLTPLEERWEAIEECDRSYRATPTRSSTEQIGLARLKEGLDLIRIGRPVLPEFAAWRYGRRLVRRHTKYVVGTAVGLGTVAAATVSAPIGVGVTAFLLFPSYLLNDMRRARSAIPRVGVRAESGEVLSMLALHMPLHALWPTSDKEGWRLEVAHMEGTANMTGSAGLQALVQLLPAMNASGASRPALAAALSEIEGTGNPTRYLGMAARRQSSGWPAAVPLSGLPREVRLALEIVANEEGERRAMEGELQRLEQAWKDAECVASIADGLLTPDPRALSTRSSKTARAAPHRPERAASERGGN